MMFSKTTLLAVFLGALSVQATPVGNDAFSAAAAPASDVGPSPEIADGVGIVTWSGKGCKGKNQGTTLAYQGNTKCVNWSNAGSADFQKGTLGGCESGSKVIFYHNTGCKGTSYATVNHIPYGCQNLNSVAGGHGSGKVVCN